MRRIAIAAIVCLTTFTASAAEEGQWRAGVAAAFSDFEGDASFPIDDSTIGLQISAQYQFNSWLGAEMAYHNIGEFEQQVNDSNAELGFTGLSFAAIGYFPLPTSTNENIDLYAKVGYFDFDVDLTSELTDGLKASIGHDTGLVVGLGTSIEISEDFNIRAGFDWYDVDNSDLWSVILGLEHRF